MDAGCGYFDEQGLLWHWEERVTNKAVPCFALQREYSQHQSPMLLPSLQACLRSYFYGHEGLSGSQRYNSRVAAKANTHAQVRSGAITA